jgi:hypothetical protein
MTKIDQSSPAIHWALSQLGADCKVLPLPKAASQRIYYRLQQGKESWVLMDASLEIDSAKQSAELTDLFVSLGVRVPRLVAKELSQGWLISEDFGDKRLLEQLRREPDSAEQWYPLAWKTLLRLQRAHQISAQLLSMDLAWAKRESMRFVNEYLPALPEGDWDQLAMESVIDALATDVAAQPQGLSHRDFHAANLMCLPDDELGVLDFQSAFYAPLVYDTVSLLRDCYIDWPAQLVERWLQQFYASSPLWQQHYVSFDALQQAFAAVSLQRHLKCLGLFVSLVKAGQRDYLPAIPRTLRYVQQVCQQNPSWQLFLPAVEAGLAGCLG